MAFHKNNLTPDDLTSENLIPSTIICGDRRAEITSERDFFNALNKFIPSGEQILFLGKGRYLWNPLENMITPKMLSSEGNTFFLTKRISKVKNSMFTVIKEIFKKRQNEKPTLLAVCSNTADILNWESVFKKIVIVERNKDSIREMEERLSLTNIDYRIVNSSPLDVNRIISKTANFMGKPDVVSFIDSASCYDLTNNRDKMAISALSDFGLYSMIMTVTKEKLLAYGTSKENKKGSIEVTVQNNRSDILFPDESQRRKGLLVSEKTLSRLLRGKVIYKAKVSDEILMTENEKAFSNTILSVILEN